MLTLQFLEPNPYIYSYDLQDVRNKLQSALDILPVTHVLIGWDIPVNFLEACKKITEQYSIKLLRWHPLFTLRDTDVIQNNFVINAWDKPIPGFKNLPEFTFVCPNNKLIVEYLYKEIITIIENDIYDGFFLDRIRFPSPSEDPFWNLGCFCENCLQSAEVNNINIQLVKKFIKNAYNSQDDIFIYLSYLMNNVNLDSDKLELQEFKKYLDYRTRIVIDGVKVISDLVHNFNLEVGLDAFSFSLTYMVGQDLSRLSQLADWTKVMSYTHAIGPAGLPYEISNLLKFLTKKYHFAEKKALELLEKIFDVQLPKTISSLIENGLSSDILYTEIKKAIKSTNKPILAGLEMVDIPHITKIDEFTLEKDILAILAAQPSGISISWDLFYIPVSRLYLLRKIMDGGYS